MIGTSLRSTRGGYVGETRTLPEIFAKNARICSSHSCAMERRQGLPSSSLVEVESNSHCERLVLFAGAETFSGTDDGFFNTVGDHI